MVHRLNGMFAFCIHDRRSGETFIARDRLGIKPLYYRRDGNRLVFASEIAVLLRHPEVARRDRPGRLWSSCSACSTCPESARSTAACASCRPATRCTCGTVRSRIERYYRCPDGRSGAACGARRPRRRDARTAGRLGASPVDLRRSAGHVPLRGARFQHPGGAALPHDRTVPSRPSRSASRVTRRSTSASFARLVADAFGTNHHELLLSPVEIAEQLPAIIDHLAEPVMDPALIPT